MYKKISLILIAFIVFVSSFAILMSNKAIADEPSAHPFYPKGIADTASKAAYGNLFWACYKFSSKVNTVSASGNKPPLKDFDAVVDTVSAITDIEKDDDTMNCSSWSESNFNNAMSSIGFKTGTPREFYCDVNSTVEGALVFHKYQCPASTGTGEDLWITQDRVAEAILQRAGSISGYVSYYIGYKMLIQECEVTDKGTRSKDDGLGDYPQIGIVKADGTVEVHAYELGKADSNINMWNAGDGDRYYPTCKEIITGHMGEKGDWTTAYAAYVKSQIKPASSTGTGGTEEECKKKYPMQQKACQIGAQHKGDSKYCETRYSKRGEKYVEACKYAAGVLGSTGSSSSSSGSTVTLPDGSTIEADPEAEGADSEEDQENCKIDYIGWIVCPIVNTLASMSEGARAKLVDMLTINAKSILGDTSEGSVYSYWSKIRDYANILFVVFFLFVIYSQMTGYGLDNYGIKRMLPKLIIGVIVVNASFYICGLLVDLSNVVGSSAFNFVSTAAVGDIPAGDWSNSDSSWINKIAAGALILTVGYFALAAVISMLLFVVITAVTTIFLLGVREAIIIMCIVLSPLAFVAMIMPNTEGLYKKWWSAFKASLMVYPMVGLVFGASNLAARILGSGLKESDIIMQSIVALLVFAPLLIVPKLVRSAVEIIGIGGAVAWLNKKMNKGRDRLTDKVGKWRENKLTSQFGKHRREKAQLRNAQIRGGTYRGKWGAVNPRNWRSGANRRINAVTGDFGQKRKLGGSAAALAEDNERMKAANAWIADNNMSSDELSQIAVTGKDRAGNSISSYQRRAAMQALAPHMTSEQAANLATASASFGDASLQKEAANAIAQSGAKKAPWLGGKQLEAIRQGTYNEQEAMSDYIQNKASGQGLANADANAVNKMVTFAENEARHNADNSYMRSLMRARADLEDDPKTAGSVSSAVRREIERIPPMQRQSNSGGGNQGGGGGNQGGGGGNQGGGGGNQGGGGGNQGGGGGQGGSN